MENTENTLEIVETGILKNVTKINVENVTRWLNDYRDTNYKNRFLTEHFWSMCLFGIELKIDIKSILGEEIWYHMKKVEPKPFWMYYHPIFTNVKHKKILVKFHL